MFAEQLRPRPADFPNGEWEAFIPDGIRAVWHELTDRERYIAFAVASRGSSILWDEQMGEDA